MDGALKGREASDAHGRYNAVNAVGFVVDEGEISLPDATIGAFHGGSGTYSYPGGARIAICVLDGKRHSCKSTAVCRDGDFSDAAKISGDSISLSNDESIFKVDVATTNDGSSNFEGIGIDCGKPWVNG